MAHCVVGSCSPHVGHAVRECSLTARGLLVGLNIIVKCFDYNEILWGILVINIKNC